MPVQAEPFLSRCSHLQEEVSAAWSSADGWWQLSGREPHASAAELAARINSQCAWMCLPSSSPVVLLPLSLPYLHPTAGLEKGISPGIKLFLIFSPFFCSGCIPFMLALLHSFLPPPLPISGAARVPPRAEALREGGSSSSPSPPQGLHCLFQGPRCLSSLAETCC